MNRLMLLFTLILCTGWLYSQVSFEDEIQPIFNENCATPYCHAGNAPPFGLNLEADSSHGYLVGVPAGWDSEFLRVEPGNPDDSYLIMKLVEDPRVMGQPMPLGGDPLPQEMIDLISQWITEGATTTDIKPHNDVLVSDFQLHQNYPNPFNPSTVISIQLAVASDVTLSVYDITGKKIKTLVDGQRLAANQYDVTWDGTDYAGEEVASGVYFYQLHAGQNFVDTKKMMLVR